jgi:flagellar biosynthesis protein FlhF
MSITPNAQLHVKSYFAGSIQEAMESARREMGSEALFLNSRPAPPEGRHLGELEVVFGQCPENPTRVTPEVAPAPASFAAIEGLRQQMDEIRRLLARAAVSPATARSRQPFVEQALLAAGIEPALVTEVADAVALRLSQRSVLEISRPRKQQEWDPDIVVEETRRDLAGRIQLNSELGRITALVGPPGSGKTTALVKLAVSQGLAKGRPVRLITADTQRIGAAEQLRTFASILSTPLHATESLTALETAIDSAPANSLVLIDTPGLSPALLGEAGNGIAEFLERRQDIDTHLVLTAAARPADLELASQRYAAFSPSRLLFTRLDEASSLGAMFCEAVRKNAPLSFLSTGQLIPEDLEPATAEKLVDSLVSHLPEVLRAVA